MGEGLNAWSGLGNETIRMQAVEQYIFGIAVLVGELKSNGTLLALNNNNDLFVWETDCQTCGRAAFYDEALSHTW